MAERIDENGVRRGNAADAGALCVTREKPKGVDASVYRRMCSQLGAPRPLKGFNPDTGEKEYDLAAVEAWHKSRPGPGEWHHDITRRTPMRHQVLGQIAAGRFTVVIEGMQVRIYRDGAPFVGRANTRVFTDLQRGEMIEVPRTGGEVAITDKARPVLERWNEEEPMMAQQGGPLAAAR